MTGTGLYADSCFDSAARLSSRWTLGFAYEENLIVLHGVGYCVRAPALRQVCPPATPQNFRLEAPQRPFRVFFKTLIKVYNIYLYLMAYGKFPEKTVSLGLVETSKIFITI